MSDGAAATVARPAGRGPALRRFLQPRPPQPERCELCGESVPSGHRHLVDREQRSLTCACTPCALLFERPGAGGGRFRTVPARYLTDSRGGVDAGIWEMLQIPVGIAFFFHNSHLDQLVALYPGPGGATESELDPDARQSVLGGSRLARLLEPDVEALLVRRPGRESDTAGSCHLVPVDVAYELVGRLRTTWQGFDGGHGAHAALEEFFQRLADRATALPPEEAER